MKFIILAAILTIIYLAFFKKPSIKAPKEKKSNTTSDNDSDEMIACHTCQTYATKDDMIFSNGHYFCSKTCVKEQA